MAAESLTRGRPGTLRTALLLGLPLLLGVTLLPFVLAGRNPLWGDEGMFAYMAWAPTAGGGALYQAGHDPKPPGIFLLYRAVRGFDAGGVARARLAVGVTAFLTAALLLCWLGVSVSPAAGLWAGLLCALLFAYLPGQLALAETPMAFLVAVGFLCVYAGARRGSPGLLVVAGVALGAACAFKYTAVAESAAAGLALLVLLSAASTRARWGRLGLLLGGFLAVWALVAVWLAATRQLGAFWHASVLWTFAGGYPANSESRSAAMIGFFRYRFCWFAVPAAAALLAFRAPRPADGEGGVRSPRPTGALTRLLGVWLLFAGAAFVATGWMVDNQTPPLFPPLAALAGIGLAWVGQGGRVPGRIVGLAMLALLVLAPLADRYQIRLHQGWTSWHATEKPQDQRLGEWLAGRVPPTERIYVVGVGVPLYLHAHRLSPTPDFYTGLGTTLEVRQRVLEALRRQPPGAVVFTQMIERRYMQDFGAQVRAWVEQGPYRRVETGLPGAGEVYLRRDLPEAP